MDDSSAPAGATAQPPQPDVRLSFANERTFLAWERTALALITAGLAITQLLPAFDFPGGRRLIGLPLIGLGILIAAAELLGVASQPGRHRPRPPAPDVAPPGGRRDRRVGGRGVRVRARDRGGFGQLNGTRSADERTDLAWNRSGLAIFACGLVVMRGLTLNGLERSDVAVGAVIVGLGMLSYVLAGWHARRRLAPGNAERAARPSDLLPLAVGVATIGVAAFVLGLFFPA